MATRKCNDKFGYKCTKEVTYENEDELGKDFYVKSTWTGRYYLHTCKDCIRRKRRELGESNTGSYGYKKGNELYHSHTQSAGCGRSYEATDYGTMLQPAAVIAGGE
jgi:hypothetical protein